MDCNDILLELSDNNIEFEILVYTEKVDCIIIYIFKRDIILLEDIEETIERLKEYLYSIGFSIKDEIASAAPLVGIYPKIKKSNVINSISFDIEYCVSRTQIRFTRNK